jgi:hypothetical protein
VVVRAGDRVGSVEERGSEDGELEVRGMAEVGVEGNPARDRRADWPIAEPDLPPSRAGAVGVGGGISDGPDELSGGWQGTGVRSERRRSGGGGVLRRSSSKERRSEIGNSDRSPDSTPGEEGSDDVAAAERACSSCLLRLDTSSLASMIFGI